MYAPVMSTTKPMSPVVAHLAAHPCRLCGGTEYSHFPELVFEQGKGSTSHRFELLVCRLCRHTDMFANLDAMQSGYAHSVVSAPKAPTFR